MAECPPCLLPLTIPWRISTFDITPNLLVLQGVPEAGSDVAKPKTGGRRLLAMHSKTYFSEVAQIAEAIDPQIVETLAEELARLRARGGRLFLLGVGGSAGNCAHAVNYFRKLCAIEAYAPTDNVSELTARTNDEGFETAFTGFLEVSRLSGNDPILIFSVGEIGRAPVGTTVTNATDA